MPKWTIALNPEYRIRELECAYLRYSYCDENNMPFVKKRGEGAIRKIRTSLLKLRDEAASRGILMEKKLADMKMDEVCAYEHYLVNKCNWGQTTYECGYDTVSAIDDVVWEGQFYRPRHSDDRIDPLRVQLRLSHELEILQYFSRICIADLHGRAGHRDELFIEAIRAASEQVGDCRVSPRFRGYSVWVMDVYWAARAILRDRAKVREGLNVRRDGNNQSE